MSENNKTYRIRTGVGKDAPENIKLNVNILQNYDTLEILSLKIDTESVYNKFTSDYGCLVGRVLANGGVGVPNVKVSMFIELSEDDRNNQTLSYLYPYRNTFEKNDDDIRYNLLTDSKLSECHQNIGSFPNKRLVLDDNNVLEVYDKYYKFTTTTNDSGDYMIFGIPTGNQKIHSDLDLSDIGMLSQKPRDLFYKGYTKTLFENPNVFKKDTNLDNLTQVMSSDKTVYIYPFWGDEDDNKDQIKITRSDINVPYKFEPTCIFIGSVITDEKNNAISKNCIPSERGGKMDRLTTGKGTIEMIRKDIHGEIESFSVQGNELIDGNGTWCYQIPMNLDYVTTNEYGELVPTDNTDIGLPTRTEVRFRMSIQDYESEYENSHLVKVLVPNINNNKGEENDYNFGSQTKDESFRDLFWNNVYSVKSYIPRYQKGNFFDSNKNFIGIKAVNVNGGNNPIPYNNMRINLTFLFIFQCIIFKCVVYIVKTLNKLIYVLNKFTSTSSEGKTGPSLFYITLDGAICPELDGHYVAPGAKDTKSKDGTKDEHLTTLVMNTYRNVFGEEFTMDGNLGDNPTVLGQNIYVEDKKSAEYKNNQGKWGAETYNDDGETEWSNIYNNEDYFIKCVELQFAIEYEVIQFDFYNDWINGCIYIPRWFGEVKRNKDNIYYCGSYSIGDRCFVQQCALPYNISGETLSLSSISEGIGDYNYGCDNKNYNRQVCHKRIGRRFLKIAYRYNGGIVKRIITMYGQNVYYPVANYNNSFEFSLNMFSTDIILLGSVEKNNIYGIPVIGDYPSSSFIMPPPTGEIVSESQGIHIEKNTTASTEEDEVIKYNSGYTPHIKNFYQFNKTNSFKSKTSGITDDDDPEEIEMSGIDWGYNPFSPKDSDDTTLGRNQVAGHFLEIGCTKSLSNVKSCINLSRICEIGGEAAQSHAYYKTIISIIDGGNVKTYNVSFLKTTGVVSKREIVNNEIRSAFASLNSFNLKTEINPLNNYKRYKFLGYYPNGFNGETEKISDLYSLSGSVSTKVIIDQNSSTTETFVYNMSDDQSKSYLNFRFNVNDRRSLEEKFAHSEIFEFKNEKNKTITGKTYYIPIYSNSFYFYFGLKNGSTAIDRLYTEYFAKCIPDNENVMNKNTTGVIAPITPTTGITPFVGEEINNVTSDTGF